MVQEVAMAKQRKRGPYRITDQDRANRRERMLRQRAAGVMATKPVDSMTDAELRRYIEQRMAQLPADVRDSVMAEYTSTLSAPPGEGHGGADADDGGAGSGFRVPSGSEPAPAPQSDPAPASHSPDAADTDLDRALAILARNVDHNRETDIQWRRNHGLRTEPDPADRSTDEQLLSELREQAHDRSGQSHATYRSLQSDRRTYLP
jgi:hypothetical protein